MNAKGLVRWWPWWAAGLCIFGWQLLPMQGHPQQSPQRLTHHVPQVVANGKAPLVGKLAGSKTIQLTVMFPLRNQTELTSLLTRLYDPASPTYRHFLTVQQFTDEFGPTVEDYQAAIAYFRNNGFSIRNTSKNRLVLDVTGTAAQVEAALNVSMNVYRDPNGKRTFFSPDREPTLNLGTQIRHIEGLDDFSMPVPMMKVSKNAGVIANVTGSGPGGNYLGSDMRAAYYGGTLLTGAGQCVGLLEFQGYRLQDVNLTFENAGQTYSVPINNVLIDGGYSGVPRGSDDAEQVLDIAQAIGMAPGLSQVRVYIAQTSSQAGDIFNSMATEDVCKQLSVSWSWQVSDPTMFDSVFQAFAAQGQSIFVASGDYGAYDPSISPYFYPAEDAFVTSVGGTHLTTNYGGGPWVAEGGWNNPPYGSGGGASPDGIPIPSWQQGLATYSNGGSHYFRNVPDVAMEADLDNYYCDLGTCHGGAGGTSFAAPRWAGFMALVNQQATEAGTAPTGGIGFLNPTVYSIGQSSNYSLDFHDVTGGNNDSDNQPVWYNALPGYDLVTGWGSPNGQNLIETIAGALTPGFWISGAPANLSLYQGTSGTTTISVTDAGGFAGSVNLSASQLPAGVTASFNPTSTPGTSELLLTADSSATLGTAAITITGTSGTLSASTQIFLTVNSPQTPPTPAGDLGSVNIGTLGNPKALTLTFQTAGTLNKIAVLTQGAPNLDFADAGGDTCRVGNAYAVNATCTVNVSFAPKYAGTRYGAVVLTDANGNQLAELYLRGTGNGPQTTFDPGSETTIGSGLADPQNVAITGDGSIYVTDYGSATVPGSLYLEKFSNGSYTQTQLNCTFTSPVGVAVDGAGTLYVTDPGVPAVFKITISNGNCTKTAIGSGFGTPWGIAVDEGGNVYVADYGTCCETVYKEALQPDGTYVQTTVGSGWVTPVGVAVDGQGKIYVADFGMPGVFMETPSGGTYTQTPIGQGWPAPTGISVDGIGNLYVSHSGSSPNTGGVDTAGIYKEVLSGGSYIQTSVGSGWAAPYGLAVDPLGNVVVADQRRGIYKEDLADPPQLAFANAAAGTTSSDSPRVVTVSNVGTAVLNFSALSYPADFPEANMSSGGCTSSTSLNPAQSCMLSINFLPSTSLDGGSSLPLNESVSVTTNTLNTAATQQEISVSGTEVLPGENVSLSVSANPSTAGSSVIFTATVAAPSSGPVPTGTVTFYNGTTPLSGAISLSNAVATYSTASLAVGTYAVSASYSGDGDYSGSNSNIISESIVAAPGTAPLGPSTLGTQNVGSTSGVFPLTFTFGQSETLGGIAVLTQGIPNLDFANTGGGTCSTGTAYVTNSTCTVNVTFSPKYPGVRFGAVVLSDSSGNVIGTAYLEGTGSGPQTSFLPGALTSLPTSFNYPQGIAVDGAGDLYIADPLDAAVYKETLVNGTYTQSTIGTGFNEPYGVAVDGAGNVYVADYSNHAVFKETPSNGSYTQAVIGYGFSYPSGVAVDGLGNIYVADNGNGVTPGAVYLETLSNGTYAQTTVAGTFVTPQGIAVDANGDLFVSDPANGAASAAVYELTPSNGTYSQSAVGFGWVTPDGVAVDSDGNVFVADDAYDLGEGFIAKETRQPDGTFAQTIVADSSILPYPAGIAVDGSGNRYIADILESTVYRQDIFDPPSLSFPETHYGQTSTGSPQTVTVQNAGNATLQFSAVSYPTDFPEASGIPTECTPSTQLGTGAACSLSIDFTPASRNGSNQSVLLSENVSITTNSLNADSNPQSLAVSGTEAAPMATVDLTAPAEIYTVGTSVTFTATVVGQNGTAAPSGSVTFYSSGTALGTVPLTNGTAAYSTNSLAVGSYTVTASYSGDQNYPTAESNAVNEQIIPTSTFGTEALGNSSSQFITLTFPSRATLGSISVVTQGATNLDFTNAGGGTCTVGTKYSAGATCTVNVLFKPLYSGSRFGAVVLGDSSGKLIQAVPVEGTGIGSQLSFLPGIPKTIISQQDTIGTFTVDENGTVYVGTTTSSNGTSTFTLTKWAASGSSYSSTTIPTSASGGPIAADPIAVDASGAVYVSDIYQSRKQTDCRVLKETLVNGIYTESVVTSGQQCTDTYNSLGDTGWNIAVDAGGNVYISDTLNHRVLKETLSGGIYTQTTIPSDLLPYPTQIAVDGSGNVYLFDDYWYPGENYPIRLLKFAPSGGTYVETVVNGIVGPPILDGNGDLYAVNGTQIVEAIPSGSGYTVVPAGQTSIGRKIAFDGGHNLYVFGSSSVTKIDTSDSLSIDFNSTNIGSTSSDSPRTVQIENVGNAPLAVSVPSSGTNPSISPNFSIDGASTCPQATSSGAVGTLDIRSSCNYDVNFTPITTGAINGSLVLSGNLVSGTQTIPLSGNATAGGGGENVGIARLTIGPNGVPIGVPVPANASANTISYVEVWDDMTHQTMIAGFIVYPEDSYGRPTCADSYPTTVTPVRAPLYNTLYYSTGYFPLEGCPGKVFPYRVVSDTWGSNTNAKQDLMIFEITGQGASGIWENEYAAEISRVTVGLPLPSGSGSNPPMSTTATLTNPPYGADGFDWQIIGGNGAIVFPNGQERMSSTTNSIPLQWPSPTPTAVPFEVQVGVRYAATPSSSTTESDPLLYGPNSDSFSSFPKDNGCQKCAAGDPITVGSGNVFESVVDYETAGQNKLSFIRYYNSLPLPSSFASTLGLRWRSNYDRFLNFVSSSLITAERTDGQLISFHNVSGSWVSDSDVDDTLTQSGTTWTLTDRDDTVETYTQLGSGEGQLQSIALRNGYTKTMAYNSSGQLSTVTDSYNRQLAFTYAGGVVSTVTSPDGLVLTYGYNSVSNSNDQLASVSYSTRSGLINA